MYSSPETIFRNVWIGAGIAGWLVAQTAKLISAAFRTRNWDFAYLVSTGGMPSAHSAAVSALATSVGMTEGFGSPVFSVAFGLAAIVMFDASTLRLNAGRQAHLLNEITRELFKNHHLAQEPLKELLGHTRLEVFMGMLVGILSGSLFVLYVYPLLGTACSAVGKGVTIS